MHEYILDSDQTSSDLVYAVAVVTKASRSYKNIMSLMSIISLLIEERLCGCSGPLTVGLL